MQEIRLFRQITSCYQPILKENLIGIYLHGSIAFQCFRWDRSDIDFIAVTKEPPSLTQKMALIQSLLDLSPSLPPKGAEMHVVLLKNCQNFVYPTPFDLHFSNMHTKRCKANLQKFCREMHGTDKDLAAHFAVIYKTGITMTGKPISSVFSPVPGWAFADSIKTDVKDAKETIYQDPVSVILNLCRVLAYLKEEQILSKPQGGLWGVKNLSPVYTKLITTAINSCLNAQPFSAEKNTLKNFAKYMLCQITVLGTHT